MMEYFVVNPDTNLGEFLFFRYIDADAYGYTGYEMRALFLVVILIYILCFRFDLSVLIVLILGTVLSYASHIKYLSRKEMLNYSDLKLTEAAGMATNYLEIEVNHYWLHYILYAVMLLIFFRIADQLLKDGLAYLKIKKTFRYCKWGIVIAIITLLALDYSYVMKVDSARDQQERYLHFSRNNDKYVVFQFLQKTQFDVSAEEIKRNYEELTTCLIDENLKKSEQVEAELSQQELPTIIVVMGESWWNLDSIPDNVVSYSTNPMQPLWDLEERCDIGEVGVNIYGGGTVNSEAEFLLGLNTKFFTSTSDTYLWLKQREFPSLVKYFKQIGYQTTAIHPYYQEFYDREIIYDLMGFDRSIFEDDMMYTDIFDKFISDESLVKQIIYEEQKQNEVPDFIFAISVASHETTLEYDNEVVSDMDYDIQVQISEDIEMTQEDYDSFVHHVNGIYQTTLAFTQLIDYYEKQESPVMIVMFGDHCPYIPTSMLELNKTEGMSIYNDEILSQEAKLKLYSTPVISWNNFSDEPFVIDGENVNALSDKIIDYIGLPQTRMGLINKYMRQEIKTNTRNYMLDFNGDIVTELTEEQYANINTLMMIHYDILRGEVMCKDIWDPIGMEE